MCEVSADIMLAVVDKPLAEVIEVFDALCPAVLEDIGLHVLLA